MADIAILEKALRNADAAADRGEPGAAEDARVLAMALKAEMSAPKEGAAAGGAAAGGGMGRLNRGIANAADGLGAIGAAVPNALISGVNAVAGTDIPQFQPSLAPAMRAGGVPVAEEPATTMGGRFVEGMGEAAGALIPFAGVGNMIAKGAGMAANTARSFIAPFLSKPAAVVGTEMIAGGGARVGGELAAEAAGGEYGETARPFGEVAGALAAAVAPGVAMSGAVGAVKRTPIAGTALRIAQSQIAPFTAQGGHVRASDRIRSMTADPEAAARSFDPNSPLTPAQQTGERGLMQLERAVAQEDPASLATYDRRIQESAKALRDDVMAPAGGATGDDARRYLEQRRGAFAADLEGRVAQAEATAAERLEAMQPQRRAVANSVIVREEIEAAYGQARTQERELWSAVPDEIEVPIAETQIEFDRLMRGLSSAERESGDISPLITRRFGEDGAWDAPQTVQEMHGLYSALRRDARNASAGTAPNENRARTSNAVADAILMDIEAIPDASVPLGEARAWSREMAKAFDQGNVGRITGRQRSGGDAVDPALTLDATLGRGGNSGAVAAADMGRAVTMPGRDAEPTAEALQDYLRGQFMDKSAPRGEFKPGSAQDFVRQNRETLEQFPRFSEQATGAIDAGRTAKATGDRVAGIMRALNDPKQSAGAAALRGETVANGIFSTADPAATAREVKRQAAKDKTGTALRGLKGAVLDHLILSGRTGSADAAGQDILSGNKMLGALNDPKTWGVVTSVMDKREINDLHRLVSEMQKVEIARGAGAADAVINDPPNNLISFIMRIQAAKAGGKAGKGTGGAGLVIAGQFSQRMQGLLERLTNDRARGIVKAALTEDRELFQSLLLGLDSPRNAVRVEDSLSNWFAGYAGQAAAQDEDDR